MHEVFRRRIEEGLERIREQCAKRRVKDVRVVERRIGRLMQKNMRAAAMFTVSTPEEEGRVIVAWTMNETSTEWARLSEG